MNNILAFGDSNTWGLIPGSHPLRRFNRENRWTGILEGKLSGTRIIEEGLCGRTTVFEDALRPGRKGVDSLPFLLESQSPLDGLILMLGTNDCKAVYKTSPYIIGKGLERCLDAAERVLPPEKILVVSPILLGPDVFDPQKDPEFDKRSVEVAKGLKEVYGQIAERRGMPFLAASDHAKADIRDDEHLNEEGHLALADAILGKIRNVWSCS